MKIDHIGYLSKDIERSVSVFTELGFTQITDIIRDDVPDEEGASRNVLLCFLENNGVTVELVSPIGESSDVYTKLNNNGEGPYHICYAVEDIASQISEMRKNKWMILRRPKPAVAFGGSPVAFLAKRGAGIVELVESGGLSTRFLKEQ